MASVEIWRRSGAGAEYRVSLGRLPIPPVHVRVNDLKTRRGRDDLDALRPATSCAHGRALGMVGRTAIHPKQLPVIRDAFRPTPAEIAMAREVVEAAEAAGQIGAFVLPDGRFVDVPVVTKARRILALAGQPIDGMNLGG